MKRNKITRSLFALLLLCFAGAWQGCSDKSSAAGDLPILGERQVVQREADGRQVTDTVYHTIPDFAFINQDSQVVTSLTVQDKVYVTDFFFTTCPTICPKMKSQMLRVYEAFKDEPQLVLLSHTIDPKHDTVAVLRDYADRLQVSSDKWHFVTGEKDSIYSIAMQYMVTALEDEQEPGGFVHSGAFVLVDQNRHVRGIYDGTDPAQVDKLIQDIPALLPKKNKKKDAN
ncbi:SCO family protein [Pontibacter sp. JH31]|uniref:SCO family protein n=1 Tax=Pontibacter aquaedesilientis TaxID=2766980 RepID=A0ABR7XL96_9BACT|nr:SCO family protein [Pontibacter aquaedesilientis]MBD1399023.1 SCO family protein [Pontibacter aquaedesilientis]